MNWPAIYYWTRYWIIIISSIGVAGIFWGGLIGWIARIVFNLEEETALLYIGLPILIAFIPITIIFLPKHLRKAGIL